MKKLALLLAILLLCLPAIAKRKPPKRPRILGIAGVTILVSDFTEARKFYLKLIDPDHLCEYCAPSAPQFLFLPSGQRTHFEKVPTPAPASLLAEVSFLTDDLEGFKKYFNFNKVDFNEVNLMGNRHPFIRELRHRYPKAKPGTLAEMAEIHGVGEQKLRKFGPAFLAVVKDHA